mmetsp:Transcript_21843/g.61008  ORF Transcript_21843/g.61008 Transcript_21843/m.61008 type:complete len:262 (-) Transcript_21843:937-1722(-)
MRLLEPTAGSSDLKPMSGVPGFASQRNRCNLDLVMSPGNDDDSRSSYVIALLRGRNASSSKAGKNGPMVAHKASDARSAHVLPSVGSICTVGGLCLTCGMGGSLGLLAPSAPSGSSTECISTSSKRSPSCTPAVDCPSGIVTSSTISSTMRRSTPCSFRKESTVPWRRSSSNRSTAPFGHCFTRAPTASKASTSFAAPSAGSGGRHCTAQRQSCVGNAQVGNFSGSCVGRNVGSRSHICRISRAAGSLEVMAWCTSNRSRL